MIPKEESLREYLERIGALNNAPKEEEFERFEERD